jgi:hypothetical protein
MRHYEKCIKKNRRKINIIKIIKTIKLFLSYLFEIGKGSFVRRAKEAIVYTHIKKDMKVPNKTR